MAEANSTEEQAAAPAENPYQDSPIVHRICEACNCMFTAHAADPSHRCKPCHK